MRIGVLSDTHDLLRPEVKENLGTCEAVIHAGDVSSRKLLNELREIVPLYIVRGNADEAWGMDLPLSLDTEIAGIRFFVTHKKKNLPSDLSGYDVVITGHTHKYTEKRESKTLFLNPGSCGPRGLMQPVTMAVLTVLDGKVAVERIDISNNAVSIPDEQIIGKPLIERIMKKTDKGTGFKEIALKEGIPEDMAERIVRLYLTHPGIDADGIMGKMGI